MEGRDRWRARLQIIGPVVIAAAIAFAIEVALVRPGPLALLALFVGYPVTVALYYFIGRWFGKRTWAKRGRKLARGMLRRRIRKEHEFLFLSDRPDRIRRMWQRTWEAVGFSAGLAVLALTFVLLFVPALGEEAAGLLPIVAVWGGFLLAPYWLFTRLGIRIVDPVRWLILPLSRRYADRMKLSNGALVLLGLGAVVNVSFRAGASGADAVVTALVTVLRAVASVLVIATTAVAYYTREERGVALELEKEAIEMGIRDGRGMTDGEFLPRLPAGKV